MRLEQIVHFLAVVDAGSIHEGARRCGISQPAMSKSVRALEESLQTQLFSRTSRGIGVTPLGKAFASRARAIEAEWRKAREEVAQEGREQASSVALGVGQSSAILVLPEALERFRRSWPRTRVRVIEGVPDTLLPLVRDETLDFMLGADVPGRDPGIAFRPLFRSARVIAGRKGHPLRKARTLQELQSAEWIRTPPLDSAVGPVETMFVDAGLSAPQISVHCDSYHTATALMASSDMLALMSRRQLVTPFCAATLAALDVPHGVPAFTVGLHTRRDVPMSKAAAAFVRIVTGIGRQLASSSEG